MSTLPETYPEDALRTLVGMVAVGVLVQTLVATGCGGSASPETHVVRKQTSAAAAAVLFSDNFTNTILPDKGLGASWTLESGLWYEKNNTAISDLNGQDQAQENVASCLDCTVQATVTTFGVAEAGVFLRSSAAAPTTNYQFLLLSNGHVQIRLVVNGVATVLGDVASGLASLHSPATLELTANGAGPVALTGAVNGVNLLQVTDSSAGALTSAGFAGLWTNYAGVPFGAFALTGVSQPPPPPVAGVLFSDNFSHTTVPDKGLGASWTLESGLWYEKNNTAISDLNGVNEAQENVVSCLNCSVQATVTSYGVSGAGVFLRSSAAAPATNYQFVLLSNRHVEIRHMVHGVATVLADAASGLATLTSPATLELTAQGTSPVTLTGAVNGVTLLEVTDSSASAITSSGYAGIWTTHAGVPFGAFMLTSAGGATRWLQTTSAEVFTSLAADKAGEVVGVTAGGAVLLAKYDRAGNLLWSQPDPFNEPYEHADFVHVAIAPTTGLIVAAGSIQYDAPPSALLMEYSADGSSHSQIAEGGDEEAYTGAAIDDGANILWSLNEAGLTSALTVTNGVTQEWRLRVDEVPGPSSFSGPSLSYPVAWAPSGRAISAFVAYGASSLQGFNFGSPGTVTPGVMAFDGATGNLLLVQPFTGLQAAVSPVPVQSYGITDVETTAAGTMVALGYFTGTLAAEPSVSLNDEAAIIVVNTNGGIRFGLPEPTLSNPQMALDPAGKVAVVGGSACNGITILKYDLAGDLLWTRSVAPSGCQGQVTANAVTNAAGDIVIAGTFTGSVDFGTGVQTASQSTPFLWDVGP
jgi:hypothetical protein